MAHPTVAVLERHMVVYRRLWRTSVLGSFALPVLFLVGIGIGVGRYVGRLDGASYMAWIAPGLLASTAFQMAVQESTYPVYGDFRWWRAYHAMVATPVRVRDLIAGRLLYLMFRVTLACVAFEAVVAVFGGILSPWALTVPAATALLGVASATPVMGFAAYIDNDSYFAPIFRFVMIPATLFSGVFFPVAQLPEWVRWMAYALPLWHGVDLVRAATLGTAPSWPVWAHALFLLAWASAGFAWAARTFTRRLND